MFSLGTSDKAQDPDIKNEPTIYSILPKVTIPVNSSNTSKF